MFFNLFFLSHEQLLRRNPERRLGSGEKDAEEVKKQPFFRVSPPELQLLMEALARSSSSLCLYCSSLSVLLFRHFLMYKCSRKDSQSSSSELQDVVQPSWLLYTCTKCLYADHGKNLRKNEKSDGAFIFLLSSICFPPECGLGGPAAEESAPSLHPLHWRQGRRQQLRRGVHH